MSQISPETELPAEQLGSEQESPTIATLSTDEVMVIRFMIGLVPPDAKRMSLVEMAKQLGKGKTVADVEEIYQRVKTKLGDEVPEELMMRAALPWL